MRENNPKALSPRRSGLTTLLLVALTALLLPRLSAQTPPANPPVPSVCTICVAGLCYDSFPTVLPGLQEFPGFFYYWEQSGTQWCLRRLDIVYRTVVYKNCAGGDVPVWQIVGYRVLTINCYTWPALPQIPSDFIVLNPPQSGQPPTPLPPGYPQTGFWNCHANTAGLGPSTSAPSPGAPPPMPPPKDNPTTPYTPCPATGEGFWVPDWSDIKKSGCYSPISGECPPAAAGAVVVIWDAPPKPGGGNDYSKSTPVHSMKSNGNGTYSSKGGAAPLKNPASWSEATSGYLNPAPGHVRYWQCLMNHCL